MSKKFTPIVIAIITFSVLFTSSIFADVGSPRQQMEEGVSAENVICRNNLQLMVKTNGDAICVKFSSTTRLVDSGAAIIIDTSDRLPIIQEEKLESLEDEEKTSESVTVFNSTENIVIKSDKKFYKPGETIIFLGTAIANQELEVFLEDSNEKEVFNDVIEVGNSGEVNFQIITDETYDEGTYFLISSQANDSEITPIRIGSSSIDIAATVEKFNHEFGSEATFEIFGTELTDITIAIFDSHNQKIFEDTIGLGEKGYAEYLLDLSGYGIGVFSAVFTQGTEEIVEEFTVGLNLGTMPIEISSTNESYEFGEIMYLYGKTSRNTLFLIEVAEPSGEILNRVEYYTDNDGKFSYRLKIPNVGEQGLWKVTVSNKSPQIAEISFQVRGDSQGLVLVLDKTGAYYLGEYVTISGYGLNSLSQITIQIKSTEIIDELTIFPKNDYSFSTIWQIPTELDKGTYDILADDGENQGTIELLVK